MRSRLTILTVLSVMTLLMQSTVSAQWAPAIAGPPAQAAGNAQYGYYVPVITMEDEEEDVQADVQEASFSTRFSDQESGCASGPTCAAGCDSRCGNGGCAKGCRCLGCRRNQVVGRAFGSLEHMSWYQKGISLPPLVTTSPAGGPFAGAGVLPAATVLFGNDDYDSNRQTGARFSIGWWMDDCHDLGIGAKLYGVESGALRFAQSSTGIPVLARPFINTDPAVLPPGPQEDALVVAFPAGPAIDGNIAISATSDVMGTEVFFRSMVDSSDCYRLDIIGGWQFNRIDSDLAMSSRHVLGATTFQFNDLFDTENTYNAGVFGLYGERYREEWTLSVLGKIGVGNMREEVTISGNNTVIAGGAVTTNGGFYAQPTNIGTYAQDLLVWSPEVNLKLAYAITPKLSVSVGYSFLYWSKVAFAGDQLDRNINTSQLNGGPVVGPADPGFAFNDTDFWVQTVDLGLNWNY